MKQVQIFFMEKIAITKASYIIERIFYLSRGERSCLLEGLNFNYIRVTVILPTSFALFRHPSFVACIVLHPNLTHLTRSSS